MSSTVSQNGSIFFNFSEYSIEGVPDIEANTYAYMQSNNIHQLKSLSLYACDGGGAFFFQKEEYGKPGYYQKQNIAFGYSLNVVSRAYSAGQSLATILNIPVIARQGEGTIRVKAYIEMEGLDIKEYKGDIAERFQALANQLNINKIGYSAFVKKWATLYTTIKNNPKYTGFKGAYWDVSDISTYGGYYEFLPKKRGKGTPNRNLLMAPLENSRRINEY